MPKKTKVFTPEEKNILDKTNNLNEWNSQKFKYHFHESDRQKLEAKRGEVYFADLGENIGCETNKIRPVVIISNNNLGIKSGTCICAIITTSTPKIINNYVPIKNTYNYKYKGKTEKLKGYVNLTQIRTIAKERLVDEHPICTLTTEMNEIDLKLIQILELTNIIKKKDNEISSLKGKVEYLKGLIDKK